MKFRKFLQNKLWRDKAPSLMEAMGSVIHTKQLSDEEYGRELCVKLLEEAQEVQKATSQQELASEIADVFEVTDALLQLHGIDMQTIQKIKEEKLNKRGGFTARKFVTIAEHPAGGFGEQYCLADPTKYPEIIE